jgi:hypothetical protein
MNVINFRESENQDLNRLAYFQLSKDLRNYSSFFNRIEIRENGFLYFYLWLSSEPRPEFQLNLGNHKGG